MNVWRCNHIEQMDGLQEMILKRTRADQNITKKGLKILEHVVKKCT